MYKNAWMAYNAFSSVSCIAVRKSALPMLCSLLLEGVQLSKVFHRFFLFHPLLLHASVSCLCYANTRGAAYEHAGASLSHPIPVSAAAAATCHRLLLARRPQFPGCCCNCSVHQLQQPSHVIGACHAIRLYTSSPR